MGLLCVVGEEAVDVGGMERSSRLTWEDGELEPELEVEVVVYISESYCTGVENLSCAGQ